MTVIEARVVGDEQAAVQAIEDLVGDLSKTWRVRHHGVVDAGQALDVIRDTGCGLQQRRPFAHAVLIHLHDADFGDRRALRWSAIGLDIDKGDTTGELAQQGWVQQRRCHGGSAAGAIDVIELRVRIDRDGFCAGAAGVGFSVR